MNLKKLKEDALDIQSVPGEQLFKYLEDGIIIFDKDRNVLYLNPAAEVLLGYRAEDLLSENGHRLFVCKKFHNRVACDGRCMMEPCLFEGKSSHSELFLLPRQGDPLPVETSTYPLFNPQGTIEGAIRFFKESKTRFELPPTQENVKNAAYIDDLTDLANRRFSEASLNAKLAEMRRFEWPFGVALLDVDDFREVNDTYGQEIGDAVLKHIASLFLTHLRSSDIIGRWGGETFIAIFANTRKEGAYKAAEKFRNLIEKNPFETAKEKLKMTLSAGVTEALSEDTFQSLMKRVEDLLRKSKQEGKNRVLCD